MRDVSYITARNHFWLQRYLDESTENSATELNNSRKKSKTIV